MKHQYVRQLLLLFTLSLLVYIFCFPKMKSNTHTLYIIDFYMYMYIPLYIHVSLPSPPLYLILPCLTLSLPPLSSPFLLSISLYLSPSLFSPYLYLSPFLFSLSLFSLSLIDYLLSNNHVNSLIVLKLDFSDEEVLAYYISFLKTLSFKLNKHTIHFFFNEVKQ